MGTRSLTHVKDDVWEDGETPQTILTIYRQMDGYPSGHGKDLADFLSGFAVVNGFGGGEPRKAANGMGCLAAQLVKELKDGIGSIYVYRPDASDCGEEYVYTVYRDGTRRSGGGVNLKVEDIHGGWADHPRTTRVLFDGPVEEFDAAKAEAARDEGDN